MMNADAAPTRDWMRQSDNNKNAWISIEAFLEEKRAVPHIHQTKIDFKVKQEMDFARGGCGYGFKDGQKSHLINLLFQ